MTTMIDQKNKKMRYTPSLTTFLLSIEKQMDKANYDMIKCEKENDIGDFPACCSCLLNDPVCTDYYNVKHKYCSECLYIFLGCTYKESYQSKYF